jgi:hypothetical protein
MHEIEPFYRWQKYYNAADDEQSPFYGREYQVMEYTHDIYGYYIHPYWDHFGSETLYVKILFAEYQQGYAIIEFLGEWNDALYNDIMFLKTNLINPLIRQGIDKFILIGENVMNFHGSDDCYYEEWFEDVEDGWIAAINFRDFVCEEWQKYNLDWYINFGGSLEVVNWRTLTPANFFLAVQSLITLRIGP